MPHISDKNVVNAIAREYCSNGHKKVKALLAAGYAARYSNTVGLKLFQNEKVCKAIAKIMGENKEKYSITADELTQHFKDIMLNKKESDTASSLRAAEDLGRHIGYNELDNQQQSTEKTFTQAEWVKQAEIEKSIADDMGDIGNAIVDH